MRRRLPLLLLVALAAACRTPEIEEDLLPGVPRALTKTVETKFFAFKVLLAGWEGPKIVPGGMRFLSEGDCARIEIAFRKKGEEGWEEPDAARKRMRSLGDIGDPQVLEPIKVSGRFASRVRYATHEYGGEELFGQEKTTYRNEEVLVPSDEGNHSVRFRTCAGEFDLQNSRYLQFLDSVKLMTEGDYLPDKYYLDRRKLVKEEFGKAPEGAGPGGLEHILD